MSGTPTAAGTASFKVKVTDPPVGSLSQNYTLTVNPAPTFGPATLTRRYRGAATNQGITVSGGTTPYATLSRFRTSPTAARDWWRMTRRTPPRGR